MNDTYRSVSRLIQRGSVGPFYAGKREIVRRIFVTVRDRAWREIGPTEWHVSLDAADPCRAHLRARHVAEGLDLAWEGIFVASEDSSRFSFSMEGEALCDMELCRVGLVILHPIDLMVGADLKVKSSTHTETLTVQPGIYPQSIVEGLPAAMTEPFSELTVQCVDGARLELRFAGELFEMEDQRNWADNSFKTYCTPLRLGFPRKLAARARIEQRIEGRWTLAPPRSGQRSEKQPETLRMPAREGRFPAIGRMAENPADGLRASGRDPDWHHVHIALKGADSLDRAASVLQRADVAALELGVEVSEEPRRWEEYRAAFEGAGAPIVQLIAYGPGVSLPSASAVAGLRQMIRDADLTIPVLVGTRGYFVELNRGETPKLTVDGMAFPLSHTVHETDERTIAENVPSIADMAETVRRRWQSSRLALVPVGLFYPAGEIQSFPAHLLRPWLIATLIHAALSQVETLTLSEDILRALDKVNGGAARDLLDTVLRFRGWSMRGFCFSHDLHAAILTDPASVCRYVLAANLGEQPRAVPLGAARANSRDLMEIPAYEVSAAELA